MKLARGQAELLAHPAVGMHAEHFDVGAAVRFSTAAGDALLTIDIRLHRTPIAGLYVSYPVAYRNDFNTKLVTQDTRIGKERLFAGEGVEIGAAYANSVNADERLAGSGTGDRAIGRGKFPGLVERDLEHEEENMNLTANLR